MSRLQPHVHGAILFTVPAVIQCVATAAHQAKSSQPCTWRSSSRATALSGGHQQPPSARSCGQVSAVMRMGAVVSTGSAWARTNVLAFCPRGMPGLVTKLATAGLLAMAIEKACVWGHGIRELSPFQPAEHAWHQMPMHSMGHAPRSPRALHATSRAWAAAVAQASIAH